LAEGADDASPWYIRKSSIPWATEIMGPSHASVLMESEDDNGKYRIAEVPFRFPECTSKNVPVPQGTVVADLKEPQCHKIDDVTCDKADFEYEPEQSFELGSTKGAPKGVPLEGCGAGAQVQSRFKVCRGASSTGKSASCSIKEFECYASSTENSKGLPKVIEESDTMYLTCVALVASKCGELFNWATAKCIPREVTCDAGESLSRQLKGRMLAEVQDSEDAVASLDVQSRGVAIVEDFKACFRQLAVPKCVAEYQAAAAGNPPASKELLGGVLTTADTMAEHLATKALGETVTTAVDATASTKGPQFEAVLSVIKACLHRHHEQGHLDVCLGKAAAIDQVASEVLQARVGPEGKPEADGAAEAPDPDAVTDAEAPIKKEKFFYSTSATTEANANGNTDGNTDANTEANESQAESAAKDIASAAEAESKASAKAAKEAQGKAEAKATEEANAAELEKAAAAATAAADRKAKLAKEAAKMSKAEEESKEKAEAKAASEDKAKQKTETSVKTKAAAEARRIAQAKAAKDADAEKVSKQEAKEAADAQVAAAAKAAAEAKSAAKAKAKAEVKTKCERRAKASQVVKKRKACTVRLDALPKECDRANKGQEVAVHTWNGIGIATAGTKKNEIPMNSCNTEGRCSCAAGKSLCSRDREGNIAFQSNAYCSGLHFKTKTAPLDPTTGNPIMKGPGVASAKIYGFMKQFKKQFVATRLLILARRMVAQCKKLNWFGKAQCDKEETTSMCNKKNHCIWWAKSPMQIIGDTLTGLFKFPGASLIGEALGVSDSTWDEWRGNVKDLQKMENSEEGVRSVFDWLARRVEEIEKEKFGWTPTRIEKTDACDVHPKTGAFECPDDEMEMDPDAYFEDALGNTFHPKVVLGNLNKAMQPKIPLTYKLTIENKAERVCCKGHACQDFNAQANRCTNAIGLDVGNLLKDSFDMSSTLACVVDEMKNVPERARGAFKAFKDEVVVKAEALVEKAKELAVKTKKKAAKAAEKTAKQAEKGVKKAKEHADKTKEKADKAAERTAKLAEKAEKKAKEVIDKAKEKADKAAEKTAKLAEKAEKKAKEVIDKAKEKTEKTERAAKELAGKTKEKANKTEKAGKELATKSKEKADKVAEAANKKTEQAGKAIEKGEKKVVRRRRWWRV